MIPRFLPIRLTIHRQLCLKIGRVTVPTIFERLMAPDTPPRDISLDCNPVAGSLVKVIHR